MKIPPQFQAAAGRFGVPLPLVVVGAAFVVLLILALLIGLVSSATRHTPQPQTNHPPLQAQAGPAGPATAVAVKPMPAPVPAKVNAGPPAASQVLLATAVADAMLPAVTAPPSLKSGAWQVQVFTLPIQGQSTVPPTLVGTATQQGATASIASAIPIQLAPFITPTSPVRLTYSLYFQVPQAGQYLLALRLAGKATASLSAALDGRADTILQAARDFNPYWPDKSPPQASNASVNLAAGLHQIVVTVDCKATQAPAAAATVDLYIKPMASAMPTAMVPLWPASAPANPASAPAAPATKEPRHG